MSPALLEGIVIHKSSRNVRVATSQGDLLCSLRGRFRGAASRRLPVVVGDRVRVREVSPGEGVLEETLPRRSELRRSRAGSPPASQRRGGVRGRSSRRPRGEAVQDLVIAANVDQVSAVLAARSPVPSWGLVDRILVSAGLEELEASICVNKWDQLEDNDDRRSKASVMAVTEEGEQEPRARTEAAESGDPSVVRQVEDILAVYRQLGYPVFRVSALHDTGLEELSRWLAGKTTVLSGHSGVGKSTLLNVLCPGVNAKTGEVSKATGKGRHVTAAASLYGLRVGGFLVDTPGFREYGLGTLAPPGVGRLYPEFRPYLSSCRYTDCLHLEEPQCAVREAREAGKISGLRYKNYRGIVESLR